MLVEFFYRTESQSNGFDEGRRSLRFRVGFSYRKAYKKVIKSVF